MKGLVDKMERWIDHAKEWARHMGGLGRSARPRVAQRVSAPQVPIDLGDNFPVIDLEAFRIGLRESWLVAMMSRDESDWEELK